MARTAYAHMERTLCGLRAAICVLRAAAYFAAGLSTGLSTGRSTGRSTLNILVYLFVSSCKYLAFSIKK